MKVLKGAIVIGISTQKGLSKTDLLVGIVYN